MIRAALLLMLACGAEPVSVEPETVEVRSWLEGEVNAKGGTLVVQTVYEPGGEVDLPRPDVEGLTFEASDDPMVEQVGTREVLTQRYRFSGTKGMYEIGPLVATWHGGEEPVSAGSSPLFVDISVDAPREAEPADIVEPAAMIAIPWGFIGAGALGVAVLGGGVWVAFGLTRRREVPEAPPEPPDVICMRAWEVIRADPRLDDYAKAEHLSRIYRIYTEAVLAFPATAWTTTEILTHLRSLTHMPEGNVPRAKRLLRATDRVKYADHRPEHDFFDDLDADLRAFVASTRPQRWDGEER